jgi:hypothetical protein
MLEMEPDRASSVQFHQRQLRRHAAAYLGAVVAAIRGTTARAGLSVEAVMHSDKYQTGWTVTNALTRTLNLEPHAICPAWSYTLRPRQPA